jgi:predicted Zn-ribbon and HTH transcriptional regulator
MNHLLYDLSGNLSYSDDVSAFDEHIEMKKCNSCGAEVEEHFLSKNKFCPPCQAECDQVDWK